MMMMKHRKNILSDFRPDFSVRRGTSNGSGCGIVRNVAGESRKSFKKGCSSIVLFLLLFALSQNFLWHYLRGLKLRRKVERPKVILHVGPGKMGTTSLQTAMVEDMEELSKDNFCVFEPRTFVSIGCELLNNNAHPDKKYTVAEMLDDKRIKRMLDYFDHCHDMKQPMLLSTECLGLHEKEVWEGVLKPSLERWDITIALGYRRFYSWAPSVWFQIMRQKITKRWPKNDHETIIPFHDWYHSNHGRFCLKALYTDMYMNHWKGMGIENFLVYNMHEDPNFLRFFFCSTLRLKHTCKKHFHAPTKEANVGFSIQNDRLACALHSLGYINPERINRIEAGKMISDFFLKNVTSLDKVSPSCFTNEEMNRVLERSKKLEAELFPEFHERSQGEWTMAYELEAMKDKYFCDVNITDVIDHYSEELQSLFA
mmetsp:Transcript_12355/g.17609  ORF Transcript_12355/g.17609 Transcript_12355/m.17609 type:complete len:426 (+) Transcript_12355:121-1398(+)